MAARPALAGSSHRTCCGAATAPRAARNPDEVRDLAGFGEALVLKLDVADQSEIDAA